MITLDEILGGTKWTDIPEGDIRSYLYRLHFVSNVIRARYNKPLTVTSGFRTWSKHREIYVKLNEKRQAKKLKQVAPPEHSLHLIGAALDVSDPKGELKAWLAQNLHLAEELGIYFEAFDQTPDWVHWQILPPASGNRFLIPY